jgi:hypothetical protein
MHVLRVGRVLLPVLIVAAVVAAGSSVLSARPHLDKARHNVDTSWSSVSVQLDHRYVLLAAVDDALRPIVGPTRTVVGDVDATLVRWRDARKHSAVATQVAAANDVEAFARRLLVTEAASPRVRGNAAVLSALGKFLSDPSRRAAVAFNQNVVNYERERRGPVRAVVASLLGDGAIPVLDTTEPTVAATASS